MAGRKSERATLAQGTGIGEKFKWKMSPGRAALVSGKDRRAVGSCGQLSRGARDLGCSLGKATLTVLVTASWLTVSKIICFHVRIFSVESIP